jgi:signal transduction histidine kinase/ActR/RegA family two-component response regulator
MKDKRTYLLVMAMLLAMLGILVMDVCTPLGVEDWIPYVAVVLVSVWLPSSWHVYATAGICSVLTVAGLFLSPSGGEFWLAIVNRFMGILAFWTVAFIGLKARRIQELERSNRALQQEIRHREKLESQLLRTQRLESIGVLTGGIAHDFNNLLTPILMSTKLLQEERPDEERQHLLGTLRASAERAAALVRKLLAFAGGMVRERTSLQLKDVVTEVVEIVSHTFPKTILLRTDLGEGLPPVLADATQLSQVLMNLCVNARDAMPSGGTLSIALDMVTVNDEYVETHADARQGVFVRLKVEDTGSGMSPEILDQAFDPFFTTKTQDKGTGLGLSMALGIVRSHGGFLQVDSEVGCGCRFAIYLPVQSTEAQKPGVPAKLDVQRGNGEMVLVVDDESPTLETVKAVLQSRGYHVLTACGGEEALTIYDQNRAGIHAVLLDMMMPGMDGLAVMARLHEKAPDVRIIASSGLGLADGAAQTMAANQVPFLPKPYSEEQLLAALAKLLRSA